MINTTYNILSENKTGNFQRCFNLCNENINCTTSMYNEISDSCTIYSSLSFGYFEQKNSTHSFYFLSKK